MYPQPFFWNPPPTKKGEANSYSWQTSQIDWPIKWCNPPNILVLSIIAAQLLCWQQGQGVQSSLQYILYESEGEEGMHTGTGIVYSFPADWQCWMFARWECASFPPPQKTMNHSQTVLPGQVQLLLLYQYSRSCTFCWYQFRHCTVLTHPLCLRYSSRCYMASSHIGLKILTSITYNYCTQKIDVAGRVTLSQLACIGTYFSCRQWKRLDIAAVLTPTN